MYKCYVRWHIAIVSMYITHCTAIGGLYKLKPQTTPGCHDVSKFSHAVANGSQASHITLNIRRKCIHSHGKDRSTETNIFDCPESLYEYSFQKSKNEYYSNIWLYSIRFNPTTYACHIPPTHATYHLRMPHTTYACRATRHKRVRHLHS